MIPLLVLLADDHEILRKGLRKIIEGQPGWTIVAEDAWLFYKADAVSDLVPAIEALSQNKTISLSSRAILVCFELPSGYYLHCSRFYITWAGRLNHAGLSKFFS